MSPLANDFSINITNKLFQSEMRRIKTELDKLIDKNINLMGPQDGFLFNGKLYTKTPIAYTAATKKILHNDLVQYAIDLATEQNKLKYDAQRIKQNLINLVKPCTSEQDIRDTLPNCLVQFSDELRKLPRINKEAFTIIDDGIKYKQYLKVRPLIEYYSSTALIY